MNNRGKRVKNMNSTTLSQPRAASTLYVSEAGKGHLYLVASSAMDTDASHAASAAYTQIGDALAETGAEIVHERIFGSLSVEPVVMAARQKALLAKDIAPHGPVTYIAGHPPWDEGFAGVIIHAVRPCRADDKVWMIMDGGIPCGRGWRRNGASFLILQNIQGLVDDPNAINVPLLQAQRMIERAERILGKQGASFRDVIRTWFYLSDILDWYGEFNEARNTKYEEFGIMPRLDNGRLLLPASTGIAGDNPQGAAGVLDLLAVAGTPESRPLIRQHANPRQKDAFCYGSAFSRGALIRESDVSVLQVSGTAAVGELGETLYPGDIRGQIEHTFNNIETLIRQEGARLQDICAATVFVKRPEDAELFWRMAAERGLSGLPAVCVVAELCRDELLFEIDAEVVFDHRLQAVQKHI